MSSLSPTEAIAQLRTCRVCGSADLSFRPAIGDALAAGWGLSPEQRAYIDLQQGLHCRGCGASLRVQTLAGALLAGHQAGGDFIAFCRSHAGFRQRRVLEINSAGALNSALRELPHHTLASYPEVDLQKLSCADETWDVIVHSDTLEHIPDPRAALSECHRTLRPGGWLAFTIPIVHGRLTRTTEGRPPTWHGGPDTTAEDWRVCTEYGADFYQQLFAAGFSSVQMHTILFPAAVALVAIKGLPPPAPRPVTGFAAGRGWGRATFERRHRYSMAAELAAGRRVLDIASGDGGGSLLLASRAALVIGVDHDPEGAARARAHAHAPTLEFRTGPADRLPLDEASVDLAVTFEAPDPSVAPEAFLSELKRVLRSDGLLLISVPGVSSSAGAPGHEPLSDGKTPLGAGFEALLRSRFAHVALVRQRFAFGSVMTPGPAGVAAVSGRHAGDHNALALHQPPEEEAVLIAACSDAPLPELPLGTFAGTGDFASDLDTLIGGDVDAILNACPLAAGTGLRRALLEGRARAEKAAQAEAKWMEEKARDAARCEKIAARLAGRDAELQRLKTSRFFKLVHPFGRLFGGW